MADDEFAVEWHEAKRLATIAKHGIDFLDLATFFDGPLHVAESRGAAEPRFVAIGRLGRTTIAVVFTWRGDKRRIITARKARRYERENFRALYPEPVADDEGSN